MSGIGRPDAPGVARAASRLRRSVLLAAMVAGTLAAERAGGEAVRAQTQKIQLDFPSPPNLLCGAELPGDFIRAVPENRRAYIRNLLGQVYPDIVELYGEPQVVLPVVPGSSPPRPLDHRPVAVYYTPGADGSMYLTHKSDVPRIAALVAGGILGGAHPALFPLCGVFTEIPDHALFLNTMPCNVADDVPCDQDFDHTFTHEIIHVFHDRMSYLGWYTHSWIEEGMTEAAAELVADLRVHDGKGDNLRRGGINAGPWDNLKHYDMWSYPQNGAWNGDGLFSALHGIQYFFGGVAVPDPEEFAYWSPGFDLIPDPPGDHEWLNKVIEPNARYGAAASVWLMLAKAFSDDPARPTFLRRLNEQLAFEGVESLPDTTIRANEAIFELIGDVAGARTIEGLSAQEWLERQWVARTFPSARGALFIDVRNPENVRTYDPAAKQIEIPDITVYALVSDDLPSAANPLGWAVRDGLQIGELPVKDCPITLSIRAVSGQPLRYDPGSMRWRSELAPIMGRTDGSGRLTLLDALRLNAGPLTEVHAPGYVQGELPPGAYAIYAEAGACPHRITFRTEGIWPFSGEASTKPGGMFASTYFVVGGGPIGGDIRVGNPSLAGVTTVATGGGRVWGSGVRPRLVGAEPIAERLAPSPASFTATGPTAAGAFRITTRMPVPGVDLTNASLFQPEELLVGLPDPDAPGTIRGARQVFKPNPYTRLIETGVAGDFDMRLAPMAAVLDPGDSVTATLTLTPYGVMKGAPYCAITVHEGTLPRGVTVDFAPNARFVALPLDDAAPATTSITVTFRVGPEATPARTSRIDLVAIGSPGECDGRTIVAPFELTIPPPIVRRTVDAVALVPAGGEVAIQPAIEVRTAAGVTSTIAPFAVDVRQGVTMTLRAPTEVDVAGQRYRWVDWIFGGDPAQRDTRNPAPVGAPSDVALTARYRTVARALVAIDATGEGATAPIRLPVPVAYRYPGGLDAWVEATRTTPFEVSPPSGIAVTVEAPLDVVADGRRFEFVGWDVGGATVTTARMTRVADGNAAWTARYRRVSEARVGLSVFPAVAEVSIGRDTSLDVRVDGLTDVYAAQFELAFDPALVEVVDADPTAPGVQVSPGDVPPGAEVILNAADNVAGRVVFAASLAGERGGDDHDGVLARIALRGRAEGLGDMTLTAALVADPRSRAIDAATRDGVLRVARRQQSVVPHIVVGRVEPSPRGEAAPARVCAGGTCTTTAADGSFALPDVRLGDVLTAARPGDLSAARRVWAAPDDDGLALPPVALLPGDIDADDEIGAGDAAAIARAWGAAAGDARYEALIDLDADGRIDAADLAAAQAHFLWRAPVPWPDPPDPTPEPGATPPIARGRLELVPGAPRPASPLTLAAIAAARSPRVARTSERGMTAIDAQDPPTTTVRATEARVGGAGGTAQVDIVVAGVQDLIGYAVRVRFDPRVLAVRDVDPEREGIQVDVAGLLDGPERLEVFNAADNAAGDLQFTVMRRYPADGVAGGGRLATLAFDALRDGESPIVLQRVELFRGTLADDGRIAATVYDGRVRVGAGGGGRLFVPIAETGAR